MAAVARSIALVAAVALALVLPDATAEAHVETGKSSALRRQGIHPSLDPVDSDKFFKKDYPDDLAPKVAHHFDHPFPTVQDDDRYDKDYVRDENDDGGEWKAQTEYDNLRNKLRKEQLEADAAKKKVDEEYKEWQKAKADEEAAEAKASDLEKAAHDAAAAAAKAKKDMEALEGDGSGGAVGDALSDVEKEMRDLKNCEEELEKARKKLEELTKQKGELEGKEAEKEKEAADAEEREVDADEKEATYESRVAEETKEHQAALQQLEKEAADVARVKKELEAAAKRLRVYRKQVDPDGGVYRSAAGRPGRHPVAPLALGAVGLAVLAWVGA